jgi:LPS O-antigen subunit length determinant protein (WzzB/FepE family)
MKHSKNGIAKRLKDLWLDCWEILRHRIWWLFGTGLLLGAIGFSITLFLFPVYLSRAVIERTESSGAGRPTSELFTDKELEEIVRRENPGENPETGSVHKAIGLVRAHLKISPLSSRSFLVTYCAQESHVAQRVNEALVALLVRRKANPPNRPEVNGAAREKQSEDASASTAANESGLQASAFRVLEPPTVSWEPAGPEQVKFTVIGFLLGIMLGAGGTIAGVALDDRIRSERGLTRLSNAPVLASIPKIAGSREFKGRR